MGQITTPARRPGGCRRIRGLGLAALTLLGLMSLPAAAAQADATWTGASTSSGWSDATNWAGARPVSNAVAGTLTFPTLACGTCYTTNNDLSNLSAQGLVFSNTSGGYHILGNSLTVGGGGISDTSGGGTGDVINAPLVLSGGQQTWTVGGSGYDSLTLLGGIGGSAAVTTSMPEGDLFIDSNMEVGPVTSNGPGGFHIGGAPGSGHPGSVNATDGEPVAINRGSLVANPNSKTGPLTMKGGTTLLLGTNAQNNGTTTLNVGGTVSLSSSTTTKTFINGSGSTPGTDFSQLSASGNITLGGQLVLGQGGQGSSNGPCVALAAGDVATLVTASGTLSGTFANAPEGATLTLASSCPTSQVKIHYTSNSVTATVVSGATNTAGSAAPSPSSASTNRTLKPRKSEGRLLGPASWLTVTGRRVEVTERCLSRVPCRGRFSLTAAARGKHKRRVTLRCASGSVRIRADRSASVRVVLSGGCVQLLRAQPQHRLTVLYTFQPQTAQVGQRKLIRLVLR